MDYLVEYDKSDPISIEMYSQRMIGKTFREICEEDDARGASVLREEGTSYGTDEVAETKRNKGNLGQIIEERFFRYACNSDARADFYEAGVELKVTPYRINQNGSLSAKERLEYINSNTENTDSNANDSKSETTSSKNDFNDD